VKEKMEIIRNLFNGKRIIVGRDTMDHIKGVKHKLFAFQRFLEMHPEWHNKAGFDL
jgi:trehalose 6-phosphate synthase/phosphatase